MNTANSTRISIGPKAIYYLLPETLSLPDMLSSAWHWRLARQVNGVKLPFLVRLPEQSRILFMRKAGSKTERMEGPNRLPLSFRVLP